jgi:DNA-directed RNA polymerase specialized sigma24 family protein
VPLYWYPLYAYVRRQGYSIADAQDLTQGFFVRLLEKNNLAVADRERGKFRSFILVSLKHFLANERDRAWAQKRGRGCAPIPMDYLAAEKCYGLEPKDNRTPEKIYERQWTLSLLNQALARLRQEFLAGGKIEIFETLKVFLTDDKGSFSYAETAARLHMSEGAVKVAVHRLRRRYRELLHAEVALTVDDPLEIDDEIRYLISAISC